MFEHLQIYAARERWLVGCADALLTPCGWLTRRRGPPGRPGSLPRRMLLIRLERIGDLLMTLGALEAARAGAPGAEIHLVVGSWNESLARLIPGIDSLETLDAPWLSRHGSGVTAATLLRRARSWRARRFDLAVNFEPDIRSNLLLALCGAPRRFGYGSGGGGALLTDALPFDPHLHTAENAVRLVAAALAPDGMVTAASDRPRPHSRLRVPDDVRRRVSDMLAGASPRRPLIGLHASGGRPVKQWHLDRFAQVAARLAREQDATIVLTGATEDRPLVDHVKAGLPSGVRTLDACGSLELPVLAGLLEQLTLFITGDTGPMHLAAAVGTPVVALFGPSGPRRYGPLTSQAAIVTTDLWCRPCNRVRRPPERCIGRVPDCLDRIDVERVCAAADELLRG